MITAGRRVEVRREGWREQERRRAHKSRDAGVSYERANPGKM